MVNKNFRVSLPDGAHYDAPDNENLLAAAQRARWLIRYGCRNGNCDACAATLLQGSVRHRDGSIIEAPAAKILLCLCRALTDVQIALPQDPLPGSMDQSRRAYVRLQHQTISEDKSTLYFMLPAGRKPALLANQIALIETDIGLLQARIEHEQSRDRDLVVTLLFASPLQEGTYYHVRYPLNAVQNQGTSSGKVDD